MDFPDAIRNIIGGRAYETNTVGLSDSTVVCFDDMVLKIEKQREESDWEHRMMKWLDGRLPVPKVLCSVAENGTNYLLMSKIPGEMACSPPLMEQPERLTRLLAEGLRMLWRVDVAGCPRSNTLDHKLRLAEGRVLTGLCDPEDAEPATYGPDGFADPAELLEWLKNNRPQEDLVFSHGDYCLPNIFVRDNQISGLIDLGRSGVADRYQDIALCYRSLLHNAEGAYGGGVYGNVDAAAIFEELGLSPDWDRVRYYILLDELF